MLRRCLVLGGLTLVLLLGGACSGPATMSRQSLTGPPSIDGTLDDWEGGLTYVNDPPVSVGAFPTDSLLYVALSIQDREIIRSIAANGLIVWVDPTNEQQRAYGVHYPIGLRRQRMGQRVQEEDAPSSRTLSILDQVSLSELEIVRGDSIRRRIPARFSSGLRAEADLSPGSLIYEAAIPVGEDDSLASDDSQRHGLTASLAETVSLGLETPEPDEEIDLPARREGMPSVTGRPNRRGRIGGPRRRLAELQRSEQPSLDLWIKILPPDRP